ncbi:MAG: DUF4340 domain-containing protein [Treponema sp.]|nr:DUF4340 domain-containing protein [Treponema sp.]
MTYKRKVIVLSALVAILAVILVLSLALNPEYRRKDIFAWLDPSLIVMADGIEIIGKDGVVSLSRNNNVWFFNTGSEEYPVKQSKVDDFFSLLTKKTLYPVRAVSSEARERLGITEEKAQRIYIRGGVGFPLLDLLVGGEDILGREVYLRRNGWNQIYSGEDQFTFFTAGKPNSWYDLRLFADISIDADQQAEVVIPDSSGPAYLIRRGGGGWVLQGINTALEATRVEAWLRSVIEAQGDDFARTLDSAATAVEGSITLSLGDGTSRAVQVGPADGQNNRRASVSDSSLSYILPEWTVNRLFRERSYFVRN